MKKTKLWIQECLVCGAKTEWLIRTKKQEDIVRASCLDCGHQGLFTLKSFEKKGVTLERRM